jgi:hypothetical protein
MNRSLAIPVVLAALAALLAAPLSIAKLPPGTTFEACGASGCATATEQESLELQLKLLEPVMEHGTVVAPSGAQAWFRVDLNVEAIRGLGSLERSFPVVFASDAGHIGVPDEQGGYRWGPLRAKQLAAFAQLADGLHPFPAQTLGELDAVSVAPANPDATAGTPAESETTPTALIISLGAAGLLVGAIGAVRIRRARHRSAAGEPA